MLDLDPPFLTSLGRSLVQATLVAIGSLAIGWPAGVAAGIWKFPARLPLILLIAIPLLLPSFLVAIGLSLLIRNLDGLGPAVWAFLCIGAPLVFLATLAGTRGVTRGQADAARLAGGDGMLFRLALRATRPVAGLSAVLAAVLTLADPGPGQIFGWHGAASELLISFAAHYDRGAATRQAITIAIIAAVCAWPLIWRLAPIVATNLLTRDTASLTQLRRPGIAVALALLAIVLTALPIAGLFQPLLRHEWPLSRAWSEVSRTWGDTLLYAALAAVLSVGAGFAIAAVTRPRARRIVIAAALALFALPPVLAALWLIPWSSRFTLGVALALRCLPLAVLFGLRAFGTMPRAWAEAAAVHRVPRIGFALRVAVPWLARLAAPAALLALLLATAEIGVVHLLHPPGHGTLPLAIFTIMANAPEVLVATLCLLYVALAIAIGALAVLLRKPTA